MFFRSKKPSFTLSYDPAREEPVIRRSICTGEETAGLRDRTTGHFHEVMLIRTQEDLLQFQKACHRDDIPYIY